MSDNKRKKKNPYEKVKMVIIKNLLEKPLQAKDLKTALAKEDIQYSRDRINIILNEMIKSMDIQRTILDNNPHPVYTVTNESKILAEFCGIRFRNLVRDNFITKNVVEEFGIIDKKTLSAESLIRFFGFYVLFSFIAGHTISKGLRSDWLRTVLDLEKSLSMSEFFEAFVNKDEKIIKNLASELMKNYKNNFVYMSKIFLKTSYHNLKIGKFKKFSKEIVDMVEKYN